MSEVKHTPAPWEFEYNAKAECFQVNGELHAVCTNQFCYADEAEANARLIAAAPELLEALEGLVEFQSKFMAERVNLSQFMTVRVIEKNTNNLKELMTKAYKAIAKAKGENHARS